MARLAPTDRFGTTVEKGDLVVVIRASVFRRGRVVQVKDLVWIEWLDQDSPNPRGKPYGTNTPDRVVVVQKADGSSVRWPTT